MGGYMGKIAVVDLTSARIDFIAISPAERRQWLGGSGLGARLLAENTPPAADPLGPDNLLIFMTGPMTGTAIPASGRHQVVAKSPLTGIYGEADAGGRWGACLKAAGFDGIVVRGIASQPVYLVVQDGEVRLLPADSLWGLDTYATDRQLKKRWGPDVAAACIGPAGERLVPLATIIHEGKNGRSSGRGGLGAVMGAKRLKAVVAGGSRQVPVADPAALAAAIDAAVPRVRERTRLMQEYGTAGGIIGAERIGDLPLKNWTQGTWDGVEKISGQAMAETIVTGRYHCASCPIGCGRQVRVERSPYGRVEGAGPEYETVGMFGGACLVSDLAAIAMANELCNRYGLDTISTGAVIAFAMELYEHGILTDRDLGGCPAPVWGDGRAVVGLIQAIASQEGIGRLLGSGVRRAAELIGGRAGEFAMHVKGLELPAHDPRAFYSLALGYATSNRGACHLQGASYFFEKAAVLPEAGINEVLDRFRTDDQGLIQARLQDTMCLMDSLKLCKFLFYGGIDLTTVTGWLNHLTGWDCTVAELLTTGERIFNLKRLYNVKCGVSRRDDVLPERILRQPRPDGGAAGALPPLDAMLREYYRVRGWDEVGRPRPETLARLGIDKFL
ncbi:Aldehyde ferredoxin oxidoreductase [Thermosinus carboxydivorans Nor1]|uniref:Aldehyde ferredoxin oxidoreductase n=1 Tax=Thermosinus carboxydivorans Nor1 TaxID=401526 RepID=A1HP75_9FIRM|nr:aldehyde ferredoxin oxidoreductase family protein [Thermosinus carboxydivorans]EAX48183.1 Aldehyde ferredoxin oxidoreductase [Thermosinus carboxydivorans Nor1]